MLIIIAGIKDKEYRLYGVFAGIALGMMLVGALGMNIVPKAYFGVVESLVYLQRLDIMQCWACSCFG